ncbi:MAG: mechanosensitive ion channel, partial [Spirochaetaceae bacterium]|nr:mechanosensitive ion channel [Spirochaetaceae bacterium]
IIFIATVIPSLLSISGYYLTALLLAYQMLRTMILLLIVFLISGIIQRSIQLATQKQKNTHSNDSERQTRGMYKFLMVAVISIGVVFIWSDALPMLQFLKRVQILPSIQMIDTQDEFMIDYGDAPNTEGLDQVLSAEDDQTSTDENVIADVTGTSVEKSSQKSPLTLWMIIEAILAAGIAVVLIRGLPDIIDLILRQRTSIDHGARFAVRTLLKYSLSIIGTIAVFNFLGLKWSQIQWLAAALTFGLGFGLQEIVANFVSGLILLIERPIRVNDVVTIGDLMGKVSRIQIRATTITLWDRSEMVVPNKEFVTTKLVNWTLSDSKRRIDIPLRVVYGTSLDEVKAILVACAVENPLVLDDPQPHAIIIDFATDAINIELRFVVDFGNGIQVRDEVQMAVDRIFKEKGIAFAMPQVNVQMTQAKPLNE